MRDESLFLMDILQCIQKIEVYTAAGRDAFLSTPMMQDAVIRNLEIIGEATKQISLELRQANPDVRWQQIAGLRDILIHSYMKVNLERIWLIIEQDLPGLKLKIENILKGLNENQ
ncbi:HepT-like ribonuclease domain-containing protein [Leptodesmis sichuanensis]|uniref:HepT-like ribonuclease domain-containing protein n=1 Tax=Leptodesmis sichuanensis TaxID=2906798 RepID=UPI001F455322|nr:DUF86 domain-containing protein [Leptodesmis sichuanensis]UIE36210.1 DUF86 domain-containing protein [Leptodesmis sichuanensis A121]